MWGIPRGIQRPIASPKKSFTSRAEVSNTIVTLPRVAFGHLVCGYSKNFEVKIETITEINNYNEMILTITITEFSS